MDRNTLLCGILRDSTDSVGRPYPLLVVGSGSLADWGAQMGSRASGLRAILESDGVPFCTHISQFERTRGRPGAGESASSRLGPNSANTPPKRGRLIPLQVRVLALGGRRTSKAGYSAVAKESEIFVALDEAPSVDPFTLIRLWHASLKKHHAEPPKAVFMGGNTTATRLAFFRRPLTTQDFVRLWSV